MCVLFLWEEMGRWVSIKSDCTCGILKQLHWSLVNLISEELLQIP